MLLPKFEHPGGVYCITNTVNGKRYVGQSRRLRGRFWNHKFGRANPHLRAATDKYGLDKFVVSVVAYYDDQTAMDIVERDLIAAWRTNDGRYGYNYRAGGNGGGKKRADSVAKQAASLRGFFKTERGAKVKARMSRLGYRHSEEAKAKIAAAGRGKVKSEATRLALSIAHAGRGKSAEHRAKLAEYRGERASMFGKKHPPELIERMREIKRQYWANKSYQQRLEHMAPAIRKRHGNG